MAYDMLPFPNITATNAEEQLTQINNYLIQFKETLEFILTNISEENLSLELNQKLNEMGSNIKNTTKEQGDQIEQVAHKTTVLVYDVINSAPFKSALKSVEEKIPQKYLASVTEDVGETATTYTFTDESGEDITITIPSAT